MTSSGNTKKGEMSFKKGNSEDDKKKTMVKKRKYRNNSSKQYTFEKIHATPSQFYNKFEELLNINSSMNRGLGFDIDGLERNLSKLQHMSDKKSHRDQHASWLNS